MPYTLITVTQGGRVEHTPGFETLRMCQEARSIALTGLTLEEYAERTRAEERRKAEYAARRAERLEEWRAATLPPRRPTAAERRHLRACRLEWRNETHISHAWFTEPDGSRTFFQIGRSKLGADGFIHDQLGGWCTQASAVSSYHPMSPVERAGDPIKHAVCVIEMPGAPSAITSAEAA